jgi:hypothetical protein
MRFRLLSILGTLPLLACSSHGGSVDRSTPDAAEPAPTTEGASARVLREAATFAPIGRALAHRAPLAETPRGFARRAAPATAPLREARLPGTAAAPLHLATSRAPDAWLDVRGLELESAPGELREDVVTYADAAPSTDLLLTAEAARVEETRLLRDERAPTTFRYALELGPAIVEARVRGDRVELADASGYVELSTEPAFAVDARGVTRPLSVALEGGGRARTLTLTLDARGLTFPIAVDPVWTTSPNVPCGPHVSVAILLPSGKVFATGGYSPQTCIYDPTTNAWTGGASGTPIANYPLPFDDASVSPITKMLRGTLLNDGTVLVVAGGTTDKRAAIFSPSSLTWTTQTNQQLNVCAGCGLVTLADGRVFKANGGSGQSTEIWSPTTKAWTASSNVPFVVAGEPLVVGLKGSYAGRAFVFGGNPIQNGAVWTASSGAFSGLLTGRRFLGPTAVALSDGRAMIVGYPTGSVGTPMVATLFDPGTLTFKDTALNPAVNQAIGLALLPSGLVLAAGGESTAASPIPSTASVIYDPSADAWTSIDPLPNAQAEQMMVVMADKRVMSVGGNVINGASGGATQIFTPLSQGASCAAPLRSQTCVTGYCVNSVCCSTASCPNGVCNAPAITGRAAGVCALNSGQKCTHTYDCASGFCVDGVCCNAACTGQCEACNGAGTAGTCTAVTGTPVSPRGACTGVGAGTACGPSCDGTTRTSCVYAPAGTIACSAAACTAGVMTTASKCDGKGACPVVSSSCHAYVCDTNKCFTACTGDAQCAAGFYCDTPTSTCSPKIGLGASCTGASMCPSGTFCTDGVCCGVKTCGAGFSCALGSAGGTVSPGTCSKVIGTVCSSNAECGSSHCVDGVCCDTACTGQCEACNGASGVGTCSTVTGAPVAPRAACTGNGAGSACGPSCDGTTRTSCVYAPAGTLACGAATCSAGVMTTASKCDGKGNCPSVTSSCGEYVCDTSKCFTACTADAQCAAGYYCDTPSSTCSPKTGLGAACTSGSMCPPSTFCTDGVCCGIANCGTGFSCALGSAGGPVAPGTCAKVPGTLCSGDAECGSGHCVDGVCCDTACTDACAACDVVGKKGTCSPVLGPPHGTARSACDDGGANKCAARQCDGTAQTAACNGYVNDGTIECAAARCDGGRFVAAARCDGAGACVTPVPSSCGKYVCDAATTVCKTACATNADCAPGSVCNAGRCTDAPSCSTDGTASIDPVTQVATPCAPYRCATTGACGGSCATTDDCQAGLSCDKSSGTGQCVAPPSPTSSSGGCAAAEGASRSPWAAWAALAGLAFAIARRRRRA